MTNTHSPSRKRRLVAVMAATTALVVSATMAVSYAAPNGNYGGYDAASVGGQ